MATLSFETIKVLPFFLSPLFSFFFKQKNEDKDEDKEQSHSKLPPKDHFHVSL